jgi:hypothetical protein
VEVAAGKEGEGGQERERKGREDAGALSIKAEEVAGTAAQVRGLHS